MFVQSLLTKNNVQILSKDTEDNLTFEFTKHRLELLDPTCINRCINALTFRIHPCVISGVISPASSCLQRVQNAAARLITRSKQREQITLLVFCLHWFPVNYRIHFKIPTSVKRPCHTLHCGTTVSMEDFSLPSNPVLNIMRPVETFQKHLCADIYSLLIILSLISSAVSSGLLCMVMCILLLLLLFQVLLLLT